jgi:hypothetical protein
MSDASEAIATLPFMRSKPNGKGRDHEVAMQLTSRSGLVASAGHQSL